MELEKQVCSLELAKRLKELGVKQNSFAFYLPLENYAQLGYDKETYCLRHIENTDFLNDRCISAFTVAELGEMLPRYISVTTEEKDKVDFCNFRFVTGRSLFVEDGKPIEMWSVNYICDSTNEFRNWLFDKLLVKPVNDDNEANARAKMLIYLIDHKLMEVSK